jgi:hydrogenase maturation protease
LWRRAGHAVGVAEAIELARCLGRLPARVVVFGVEGDCFETGSSLGVNVRAAIEPLAAAVRAEAQAI